MIHCKFKQGAEYATTHGLHCIDGVVIPDGTRWDGASLPTWLVSLVMLTPFHHDLREASLLHDYDYQRGFERNYADYRFYALYMDRGNGKRGLREVSHRLRGLALLVGVRLGGWVAYNRYRRKDNER